MSIILDESTRVLVQGITGGEARRFLPTMKQYGTKIVAGTTCPPDPPVLIKMFFFILNNFPLS